MRRPYWMLPAVYLIFASPASGSQIISEFVPIYRFAESLTWDGTTLWVQENVPRIHRHDPATGDEIWNLSPDADRFIASAIASDGHYLWGCSWPELQIAKIDPVDGRVLHQVDLRSADGFISGAPSGLVWREGALWMLSSGPASISQVNPTTGEITRKLDLPMTYTYPRGLAWDGTAFWIADGPAALLLKIDPQTGAIIDSVTSPGERPTGLAWDGHYLWVASERLYKLDLSAEPYEVMRELRSFWWGFYDPFFDVEWDNDLLWLSGPGLHLMDPDSGGQDVRLIAAPQSNGATGIAFDGTHLWSANRWYGQLYLVDPAYGQVLDHFPYAGHEAMGMAFDGQHLWVADLVDTALYVYSWPSVTLERKLPTPGPQAVGVAWDGQALWESDRLTGFLSQLDTLSGQVRAQFREPVSLPLGIAANRRDGTMWVLDGGTHRTVELAFPPGPTHLYNWKSTQSDSSLVLQWTLTAGSTASALFVERRASSESIYTPLGLATCDGTDCDFLDPHPIAGSINYYRVRADELDGTSKYIGPLSVAYRFSYGQQKTLASRGQLRAGAYPSPTFGRQVSIWALGTSGKSVRARLYDVRGRLLRTFEFSERTVGTFGATWDGRGADGVPVEPGLYLAAVENDEGLRATVRIVLIR